MVPSSVSQSSGLSSEQMASLSTAPQTTVNPLEVSFHIDWNFYTTERGHFAISQQSNQKRKVNSRNFSSYYNKPFTMNVYMKSYFTFTGWYHGNPKHTE